MNSPAASAHTVQREAIFIVGVGRSGTSALARLLSLCGAWLPDQLLGPNDGNPKGHWEPLEALRLNEEFLSAHGSSYYDPSLRLQEDGSLDEAEKAAFIDKIGAFLDSLPRAGPVVIKEPRIVALADCWFEAARRSSMAVKIVIPVRHPGEVAASLAKRDQTSCELSNALWLKYNLLAERHSRTFPRVFVEYSSVLADWQQQISRISEALSVRFDNRDDEAIREFLTPDLHRQRSRELTESFGHSWVSEVYAAFAAAARGTRLDTDHLDEIFASYSASERTFRTALTEFRNQHSGYHWASDLKPFLARAVDECSSEIARRFGDVIPPDEMPVDPIRTPFLYQADRVSGALESLAGQGAQLQDAYAKLAAEDVQLQEAAAKLAAHDIELEHARSHAEGLRGQLIEVNEKLLESFAESRALAEINAGTKDRLERLARGLESQLEEQRRASRDRERALARDLTRHQVRLAAFQRDLSGAHARLEQLAANAASSQASTAQLFSLISALRTQAETYERSYSWRVTAPLRAIRRGGRGVSPLPSLDGELSAVRLLAANAEANAALQSAPTPVEPEPAAAGAEENELPDGFDPAAYLRLNPDVAASGVDPAHHYLSSGRHEGRSYQQELPDGFDQAAYLALNPDVVATGVDPADHYLTYGRREGRAYSRSSMDLRELPDGFDDAAYLALNPDVAASGVHPVLHYLTSGRREGRAYAPASIDRRELPDGFDDAAYLALNPDIAASGVDPVDHYLTSGRREGRAYARSGIDRRELPDGFDDAAYLALNPDVAASGIDPAHHYFSFGRREERPYSFPGIELTGAGQVRADRDSILVVGHEASRTGAPMVTLNLVANLVGRYNVVALLLGDGPLVESFQQAGAVTVVSHIKHSPVLADSVVGQLQDQFRFRFALVNSIESRVVLKPLAARFVPVVSLVHEFAAYTRPLDAFPEALLWSSEVVFSASITRQSVLQQASCEDAQSVHTLPQGRCLPPAAQTIDEELERESERLSRWMRPAGTGDGVVIVLGAGSVHLRKGVDLFIEIAARVVSAPGGGHCRFVWIGSGYDPEGDAHYSAYLADQVRRAGLEKQLFFAGETRAIETAYREADVFLMSSRLDPMPNVAVDALAHGKPVLCFDKATGISDFLQGCGLGDRCVARYLDTADMADKIRALAGSKSLREDVGEKGRAASISYFNMAHYVTRLEDLAGKAVDRTRREEQDVALILGSGLFRPDFTVPPDLAPLPLESAVRLHVRSWASGIRRRKPAPGFHPGVYLEQHGVAVEGADPTADYIRAGKPDGPWNATVISAGAGEVRELPANESIALHLHVFYPDLLPDILSRLSSNRCRPDLLVSVTSAEAQDLARRQLESYEGKVAEIAVVPNRGRDIGPFLTRFGRRILSEYAYVGHIHTKKTEAVNDAALGKTWFDFLLANLLGGPSGAMADAILASMNAERSLGIVFPDDPHAQGWNANRGVAEEFASRIGIKELPRHFNFPVGTMFWARTCALSPLVDANLQWDDYPEEPLPYDGTLLHAIERLLPLALREGTRAAVTNVIGVTR